MIRNRLLVVLPGPLWEIPTTLRKRMERLSERFEGRIVTTMEKPGDHDCGRFRLTALRYRRGAFWKPWMHVKYLLYGVRLGLAARLGGERWDLVVAYDPLRSGLIGLLVARLAGARFAPEVNGVYDSYANYLEGGSRFALACKRWLYPRVVGFTLARSDGIKTLFPSQLKHYQDRIKTPVVEYFFDFVNLEPFTDLGEEKTILFVGYPFRLKGVDLLIEAFKAVSPRHPAWKLKILGWYPDDRELKERMGGHPGIFHQPPVLPSDMPAHMGRCGIFVLPSRTEAMGRVLLEAAACAKPRLGSDLEGIPTVIENEVDGLLFRPNDAQDLAAKLDRLMGDDNLRKELGMHARMRSLAEWNAEHYFRRLFDFYGRVLRQVQARDPALEPRPQGVLDAA
ncbi:MAG: glycosyltransferase family 4 protein [Fibrobacteres bacterium]|nr:glycosyltransferase family 4 protein [Fibrobacterota bacterium]